MKKKWMLVLALAWMGSVAMAQEGSSKLLTDASLQTIGTLKTLADQISKQESVLPALSRSGAATAQQNLQNLYASYEQELQKQRTAHASEAATVKAIDVELKLVASKK